MRATQPWYTTFDGTTWSADNPVANVSLAGSPAVATYNKKLYVAYQSGLR